MGVTSEGDNFGITVEGSPTLLDVLDIDLEHDINMDPVEIGTGAATVDGGTAVGVNASADDADAAVFGERAQADVSAGVAVGKNATATASRAVALGEGVTADRADAVYAGDRDLELAFGRGLVYPSDPGAQSLVDMTVTGGPAAGTEESYAFAVDATDILKIYAEADGAGGIQNQRVEILSPSLRMRNDTGTVTATGGGSPAVDTTLNNVAINQTDRHDVIVYVDGDPAFNADYAFNYDWGFQWDESAGAVDINLTVNWDTDPGAGNDVTLRWEVVKS